MRKLFLTILLMALTCNPGLSQDTAPSVKTIDANYYDFWEGTWFRYEDGQIDTSGTYSFAPSMASTKGWISFAKK